LNPWFEGCFTNLVDTADVVLVDPVELRLDTADSVVLRVLRVLRVLDPVVAVVSVVSVLLVRDPAGSCA
jgi:hypothetical protein